MCRYKPASLPLYIMIDKTLRKQCFGGSQAAADIDTPGVQHVVPVTIRDLQAANAPGL